MSPKKTANKHWSQYIALFIGLLMACYSSGCSCTSNPNKLPQKADKTNKEDKPVSIPQVKIKKLTYDPATSSIICKLHNSENKPIEPGKFKWKIAKPSGSQATIEGTTFTTQDKAYLPIADPIPANNELSKAYKLELGVDKNPTLTFQLIYVGDSGEQAIGDPMEVMCTIHIQLKLKDIAYNPATGRVSCTVSNEGNISVQGITVHWRCITDGIHITDDKGFIEKAGIGVLNATAEVANQQLGELSFNGNQSAKIVFWLERAGDSTKYDQQSVVFTPCSLKLVAEGPTSLYGAEKEFKCRVEKKDPTESIDFDKVEIWIEKKRKDSLDNSKIKILDEDHTEFKQLSGATLKRKIENQEPIPFTIQPEGPTIEGEFLVTLKYNNNIVDELTFFWAQVSAKDVFEAIRRGDISALEGFIQKGVDINAPDGAGKTLLHHAIVDRSLGAVKLLLEKGAKLNITDNSGYTPLLAAIEDAETSIKSKILESVIESASPDDINAPDSLGGTPLHNAMLVDNERAMKLLLDKGANPNAEDSCGDTPLYYAIDKGSISMTESLLAHGAEVNRKAGTDPSMLHFAVTHGKKVIIAELINYGADKNMKDSMGRTPFQVAQSLRSSPDILDLLKNA